MHAENAWNVVKRDNNIENAEEKSEWHLSLFYYLNYRGIILIDFLINSYNFLSLSSRWLTLISQTLQLKPR